MNREKKPLYRKVNTRALNVRHGRGGKAKWSRNVKSTGTDDTLTGSMHSKHQHGLDYTPLFRFLLSRVGCDWDETYSEAVSRLDKKEPVFWIVARSGEEKVPLRAYGESTWFSGLYIDENNRLALVDPELSVNDLEPSCPCCTHTFNGRRFTKPFKER